ncbi:ATP-binding protein [Spirulina subsalsa FACHB-351]|uniref:ATP-binding protein n=1 Tax=Spirulina subsalsa FACHB-351 TaxID=234711 RepID=A0ABT3LAH0_9CYAN|nr:ATP-binding protein [Spirulina subsalsa]MCW6038506.1 ATP-binding protein [Spirulina subsalsa FACHB-351]
MDAHELEKWFNDLESDRVERKASIADSKKIRQAICAFANDLPKTLGLKPRPSRTAFS